jgi:hypothetical protein
MILEGILTTETLDGHLHIAPMGPEVDANLTRWLLKPFKTSTSFQNLFRTNRCVFHVTDDALLLAKAVLGLANDWPSQYVPEVGYVLPDACHYFALGIENWDTSTDRALAHARVNQFQFQRPFFGWNRAKHAVLEAAILASRLGLLSRDSILADLERFEVWVQKTAGDREREAFQLIKSHIQSSPSSR